MTPQDHPLLQAPKYGDGLGLHRVAWLLDRLGLDMDAVSRRAIAVTGSNGKGSTARICSELLAANGDAVGLFTSPHLLRFNERFQIGGAEVGDAVLWAAMDEVLQAVQAYRARRHDTVGAFEAQFVTAMHLFRGCRWLVVEAGIGGRYDPVRLVRAPAVGLVSLDLEHTDLLGKTLVEIAYDKMDAAPAGATIVAGESCLPLREELEAFARLTGHAIDFVGPDRWRDLGVHGGRQTFDLRLPGLDLTGLSSTLIGPHQLNNHAVAVELVRHRRGGMLAADEAARAIDRVRWPGRLERIADDPPTYIDVGHTPEGVRAALSGFRELHAPQDCVLVTGVSRNKDARGMLEVLAPAFPRIICTAAHHNGADAERVAELAKALNPKAEVAACPSIEAAPALARQSGRPVYVAGGLFVAVEFKAALQGIAPSTLRFF